MSTAPIQNPDTLAWTYDPSWTADQRTAWEHSTGELVAQGDDEPASNSLDYRPCRFLRR